eukprot:NODE_6401_length_328_cov_1324.892473_g5249_i0.p3 GENE.NODE_6401_length_328_cov_1324.892473_g5249_i0~~NODE_6401_length_328_cov_1324.892473_g5249_i0.p3  ORF type:complete len:73 (-),score=20.22 NODE_6401_length_328_cov_1324.892473_g5249_i0:19-237(-)
MQASPLEVSVPSIPAFARFAFTIRVLHACVTINGMAEHLFLLATPQGFSGINFVDVQIRHVATWMGPPCTLR